MIQNGRTEYQQEKDQRIDLAVTENLLLHEKYCLLQKGKKNYYLITCN
jgi:tyrosyl-tRNA synthetase